MLMGGVDDLAAVMPTVQRYILDKLTAPPGRDGGPLLGLCRRGFVEYRG